MNFVLMYIDMLLLLLFFFNSFFLYSLIYYIYIAIFFFIRPGQIVWPLSPASWRL